MAVYKLLDDFYEHAFSLIAIHGSLEDFRLAYFLNATAGLKLQRLKNDLLVNGDERYPVFEWYDEMKEVHWNLVKNRSRMQYEQTIKQTSMFEGKSAYKTTCLIPEYPKVDFFLKIDNEGKYPYTAVLTQRIKDIPQVITAYEIEPKQLKSKNNLIFLTDAY
ncbi:IPExxxVDY family protein [Robertkochia solimangrovi]|uniref:IPExxxVDY family protein n=1 Tax=Robertkochia solimangrovi TaxID=2213046 RepID=UPI00117F8A8B|nr:IPExxxVDY family protein [Robertkochia solimangrovi]TRZ46276.1 IPExxxVDY family protein [Robertkochia solimangrovi]